VSWIGYLSGLETSVRLSDQIGSCWLQLSLVTDDDTTRGKSCATAEKNSLVGVI
jgi:hypothetical protein